MEGFRKIKTVETKIKTLKTSLNSEKTLVVAKGREERREKGIKKLLISFSFLFSAFISFLILFSLTSSSIIYAESSDGIHSEGSGNPDSKRGFLFSGYFQNFFIFRTDSDFDPSRSIYEPWGQTVGVLGTYAEPRFSFIASEKTFFSSEFLVGFNLWSRNSPFARPDSDGMRQLSLFLRQFYMFVRFDEENSENAKSKLKVGYQYFADPLEIFVRHWIGGLRWETTNFQIFVGQVPDQTYEGLELFSNNFVNDTFILSLAFSSQGFSSKDGLPQTKPGFFAGIYNLFDNSVVRRPKFFSTGILGYHYDSDSFYLLGGIAGQFGFMSKGALGEEDEISTAGALQVSASSKGTTRYGGDIMILSPDNSKHREGRNYAFLYSGKSASKTLVLTEDEIIFKSDNIDLNIGENIASFKLVRPGYFVADFWADFPLIYDLRFIPVLGAGLTLSAGNSGKSNFVGAEGDIIIRYARENLVFDFANIFFVPGKASAYFINKINPDKLRTLVYSAEISLKLLF